MDEDGLVSGEDVINSSTSVETSGSIEDFSKTAEAIVADGETLTAGTDEELDEMVAVAVGEGEDD